MCGVVQKKNNEQQEGQLRRMGVGSAEWSKSGSRMRIFLLQLQLLSLQLSLYFMGGLR